MKTTIDVNLTPDDLAEMFIGWGSIEQADFFNLIGKHFKQADFDSEGQVCSISYKIKKNGKDFIFTLANFVKSATVPADSPHQEHLLNAYECDSLRRCSNENHH